MLKIENLIADYGQQPVLKGITLDFRAGEIHGILGMNGAGKTTFFNTIYGNKQSKEGTCMVGEVWASSEQIAFLETENYFYPYMKGGEYLQLLASNSPNFDIEAWNRIFQLPLERLVDGYSTGMKKKLAFMGILALDRPILILDEPFNGVDIESNEKITQILLRLRELGKTIILSSHIIQSLTHICDHISYLKDGLISYTYPKIEFPQLENQLKELVRQDIDTTLRELLTSD